MNRYLDDLETPCLILDLQKLDANIARMQAHADKIGVPLRPHLKTPKSVPVAIRLMAAGAKGFNVSTLNEAEYFYKQGLNDLFYCVPTSAKNALRAAKLAKEGCHITVMTDTHEGALAIISALKAHGPDKPLRVVLEIDVDGYRSGADMAGHEIEKTAQSLNDAPETEFAGIMSYAGASYGLSPKDAAGLAARHCAALKQTVQRLKHVGISCVMVSIGSTPAVLHSQALPGVTEVRCGIYIFQDLFQAGIGACGQDDIALTVLSRVTAQHPRYNRFVIDAGGLALSKDRSTLGKTFDAAYGWICNAQTGRRIDDLRVETVSQELGLVTSASGSPLNFEDFPAGTLLRIMPNHADMTAAAYDTYHVLDAGALIDRWSRTNGWERAVV